jgi:hypothetical protein
VRVKATLQKNSADGLRSRRDRETHRGSEKHTEAELKESAKGSARANRAMCATQQEINASCEPCVVRTRRSTGGMSVAVSVILLPEASHGTLPKNRNRSIQPAVGQDDALGLRLLLQDRDFGFEGGR